MSTGVAIRGVILALLFWGGFLALLATLSGFMLWMVYYYSTQEDQGGAFIFLLLAIPPGWFLWWLIKTGRADLKERWARVQASDDTESAQGAEMVATQAISSPLGAVGQLIFVAYLFTLHPLWLDRIRTSLDPARTDWLTLIIVLLALGLEHWGGNGLLRSLPKPDGGLGTVPTFVHGASRFARAGFLVFFAGMGLAAAGILQIDETGDLVNNGRNAGIGMALMLAMLSREAWLASRFSTRPTAAQRSRIAHEVAHWMGAITMYAMVELLLFSDEPMRDLEGGWVAVIATTVILFPVFWVPLQLPQFLRHLTSATTLRQELAWWGATAMVLLVVGQRLWTG